MIIIINQAIKKITFAEWLLLTCILLVGGFNEFTSCIVSVAASAYLIYKVTKMKKFIIKTDILSISVFLICLFYGLTSFWAIDKGMAFIGFLKFLPMLLFLAVLWQTQSELSIEDILPYFSAVLAGISIIAANIKFTSEYFLVSGRLTGNFQYANTFALFLLVGEIFLLKKKKLKVWDYICFVVLIAGMLYTGCRAVFVLAILSNIALIIYKFRNGIKKAPLLIFLGLIVASAVIAGVLNFDVLKRNLELSISESSFIGRFLYWRDALSVIIKRPFGIGYLGYNYIQGSIQTGVYDVMYIHNDFLQFFIDVGWIPAILFVISIVRYFCKKQAAFHKKIAVAVICAHSLFDFNLQFISITMLLLLLLDEPNQKAMVIKKGRDCAIACLIAVLILNIYMCIPLVLHSFNKHKAADILYPWNTENKIAMLENETDVEKAVVSK